MVASNSTSHSFWAECKDLFKLAAPIFVAQFCTQALALIDSIMAAQAGELQLAAVSLGSAFWSTIILLCLGITFALAPITAQLKGAGNSERIALTVWNALYPLSVVTIFSMAVVILFPEKLLLAVGSEPQLAALTQKYLWYVAPAFPALVLFNILKNTLEGLTITKPGMLVAFSITLLNIPLNYFFINGIQFQQVWYLEPMGAAGCGAATTVVAWFGAIVLFIWSRHHQTTKTLKLLQQRERFSLDTVKLLCRTGFPISFAYIIETFSYSAIGYAAASFGSRVVAAHQIANIVCIMAFMLPIALSNAIAIKTGYALGQKSNLAVRRAIHSGLAVSLVLVLSLAVVIFSLRYQIIAAFTQVAETAAIAAPLFICILAYQLQDSFYGTGLGILRGFRDNSTLMKINFVVLWLIVLPLGVWLGFYAPDWRNFTGASSAEATFGYGIYGFWSALVFGYYLMSIGFWLRIKHLLKHTKQYMENL